MLCEGPAGPSPEFVIILEENAMTARKRNGLPRAILSVSLGLTLALFFAGCDTNGDNGAVPLTGINVSPAGPHALAVGGDGVVLTATRVPAAATGAIGWETDLPAGHDNEYVELDLRDGGTAVYVGGLAPTAGLAGGRIGIRAISGATQSDWVFFTVGLTGINVGPSAPQTVLVDGEGVTLTATRVPATATATDPVYWETDLPDLTENTFVNLDVSGLTVYVTGLAPTAELEDGRIGIRAISGATESAWVFFTVYPAGTVLLAGINAAPAGPHALFVGGGYVELTAEREPAGAVGAIGWETDLPAGHDNEYVEFYVSGDTVRVTGLAPTEGLAGGRIGVRAVATAVESGWVFFTVTAGGPPQLTGITVSPAAVPAIYVGGEGVTLTAAGYPLGAALGEIVWTTVPPGAPYVHFETDGLTVYVTGLQGTYTVVLVRAQTADGAIYSESVGITVNIAPLYLSGYVWEVDFHTFEMERHTDNWDVFYEIGIPDGTPIPTGTVTGGELSLLLAPRNPLASLMGIENVFDFMIGTIIPVVLGDPSYLGGYIEFSNEAEAGWLLLAGMRGGTQASFEKGNMELVMMEMDYELFPNVMLFESAKYIYVDRDVGISSEGTEHGDFIMDGMTSGMAPITLEAFDFQLEAGWNAIHFRFELCMLESTTCLTVSPGHPDHLKWMIMEVPGIIGW